MPLSLQPSQARTVIENSEGRTGAKGTSKGHTKERHIGISRAALAERMEAGGGKNGDIFWRSAFVDIASCATVLSRTITSLGAHDFVANFHAKADGDGLLIDNGIATVEVPRFDSRDMRGIFPVHHVRIVLEKYAARPHGVHLVTFYPYIPLA